MEVGQGNELFQLIISLATLTRLFLVKTAKCFMVLKLPTRPDDTEVSFV